MILRIAVSERDQTIRNEIRHLIEQQLDYDLADDWVKGLSVRSFIHENKPDTPGRDSDFYIRNTLLLPIRKKHPETKIIYLTDMSVISEIFNHKVKT